MLNDSWDELSEEEKKEFISIGNVALENQLELMDNLLRWVKERKEEIVLKNEFINIYELLASIKKLYYPLLEKKKINLEIKSEKDILIKNDSELIAVVFRNIIANSIKFTKVNGFINIIVIKEKEEIIIEFVDNGIGIKKEILENMEKEIFTSTTIGTSGEKGTGFGLGIVIEFIKKCNGTYKIESKEGEGTKIIIRFKGNN
jgi:signal transduction histidine kinase